MQEGGAPQRARVGERTGPLGCVEDDLDVAVLDRIHDVRTSLQHLVDPCGSDPVILEETLRAAGRQDLEAELRQSLHRRQDAGLVRIAHRDECRAAARHLRARAELALGEGASEAAVEAEASPVERISGPSSTSTPGKRAKGKTASLTAM